MATQIGEIKVIIGKVELITPDGPQPLKVGDKVFADQVITTGATGAVEIEFVDGSVMALPQNSQAVLDSETFDPLQTSQEQDIAALQEAIADGTDPTNESEPTAANAGTELTGNEGSSNIQVLHEQPVVTPESGFDTTAPDGGSIVVDEEVSGNIQATITEETPDDVPVTVDDDAATNEDTTITIDVLANDTLGGGSVTSHSNPANGSVVLNSDGTFTYTPSANYSGVDSFTYTLTDSDGDSSTATANVQVNAVADMPSLVMFVSGGEGEAESQSQTNLIVNGSFEDINGTYKSGYIQTGLPDGFLTGTKLVQMQSITGWNLVDEAMPAMEPHAKAHAGVGTTDGEHYMDLGATPGNSAIVQNVAGIINGAEYKVSFDYRDKAAMSISGQAGEGSGVMQVIWNGEIIAEVQGNNRESWETINELTVVGGAGDGSNTLVFSEIGTDTDNHGMAIDNVEMFHVPYHYDLTVQAQLTDVDGSETLSSISINPSELPDGVYLDTAPTTQLNTLSELLITNGATTLSFTSDTPLTGEQINALTASVTATESSNGDAATMNTNAKVLFEGLDASSETADLAIFGDANNNSIIGGTGDDVIFGGAGADTITGGDGADTFVWTKADVGSGIATHDTVVDFDPTTNGDVLALSDLLSDSSHTIDGLAVNDTVGTGQHLQLSIKDSGGVEVQTIDLNNMAIGTGEDPAAMLNNLLSSGAINDGI